MKSGKYYVYILQSRKDSSFYIGQCDDLDSRMSKHFDGLSKYTSSKRPWRLVYFEVFENRSEAIKRENEIKRKKSRKYVEKLINGWLLLCDESPL
jgi:putative endonuclease